MRGYDVLASLSSLEDGHRGFVPDPFSFSASANISRTCLMFGIRSGADLKSPRMFFDLNSSADFSSAFKPLLNFLKDCRRHGLYQLSGASDTFRTYVERMQEVLGLTTLGVNTGDDSLEIGETFDKCCELFLKRGVVHQVFHGVQPGEGVSQYLRLSRERTVPCVDIFGLAKGHAKPYSE